MKLNKFFLLGLVSLAFAACSSDEDVADIQGGEKQSVVLKINTDQPGNRALGEAMNEGKITLKDVTIFYADDNGNIAQFTKLNSQSPDWNKLTTTGYVEHNLPAAIKQVYVVGNTAQFNLSQMSSKQKLEEFAFGASTQADANNVLLYGFDTALEKLKEITDDQGHGNVFKADLTINPLVSRIEISGIKCNDLGNQYSSIDLKALGLMNVWNKVTIGGAPSENLTLDNVLEPGTAPQEDKFVFGTAPHKWAWETITATLDNKDAVYPATGVYAYNFIAKNETDMQVKLYLAAKKGDAVNPINNTITAAFPQLSNIGFMPGKIYKLTLEFTESNIGPWDPSQTQCIQVNVTVADWVVETLKPQYQ